MPKKNWTDEERKAFGAKMKASREAKRQPKVEPKVEIKAQPQVDDIQEEQSTDDIKSQLKEAMESISLLKAAVLNQGTQGLGNQGVGLNKDGGLVGEFEKYALNKDRYPDFTERLANESRLNAVNFNFNYELDYGVTTSKYQTADGRRVIEPKFRLQLNRIVIDEDGVQTDKRYVVKRMIFHEDPEAAMVIASENGIKIDSSDEHLFLNEMRYLRARDWLFDIYWPKTLIVNEGIQEEALNGTLVQVFTKSSPDASVIDFEKLNSKLTT